uniref:GPI-anchored protein LLG1-like n=1 Tax=Erigeron canadensis TaxID=72917 RepID=UPI001CB8E2F4|nr:GPI-anchored protein LLG1-like [Erigeron canadensis]
MRITIVFFLLLLACCCFSSPISLADNVFTSHASIKRNLLQVKKACPLNFEYMNYTIITSRCKGPNYPAEQCCQAFKEFACPYADELNDLSNDCSTVMFSYINLNGKYPPGVFSSLCHEDKVGLACDLVPPAVPAKDGVADQNSQNNGIICSPTLQFVITIGLIILLAR